MTNLWEVFPTATTTFHGDSSEANRWLLPLFEGPGGMACLGKEKFAEIRPLPDAASGSGGMTYTHFAMEMEAIFVTMKIAGKDVGTAIFPRNGKYRTLVPFLDALVSLGMNSLWSAAK